MAGFEPPGAVAPGLVSCRPGPTRLPALAIGGFTQIGRRRVILPAPRLAAEFCRAEGITIKLIIGGASAGFTDAR